MGDARKFVCVCVCVRVSRWCKLADDSIFLHKDGDCFTTTDGMIIHPTTHPHTHTHTHMHMHFEVPFPPALMCCFILHDDLHLRVSNLL